MKREKERRGQEGRVSGGRMREGKRQGEGRMLARRGEIEGDGRGGVGGTWRL